MLDLRPPGLEFRILCLEDSVISFISPSSGVLLVQFSLYVHNGGLKPDSFHFINSTAVQRIGPIFRMSYMFRKYLFKRFYVQKVLYSEGPMFRRSCSEGPMFRKFYILKVLCSEGLMFGKYLFKRSYIEKFLCSEGPIIKYIQTVPYSENPLFFVGTNFFQI